MPNTSVRAAAEGMSITRRLFLRNTASASAAIAAVAIPTVAAEPQMSARDRAIWHMRELERLAIEDGAGSAMVMVVGRPWGGASAYEHCKTLMLDKHGNVDDFGDCDFLAQKGGAA